MPTQRRRQDCATCGHHSSLHGSPVYNGGCMGTGQYGKPSNCGCPAYVRPAHRQRRVNPSDFRARNRAGRAAHKGVVDDTAAAELELYIANDGELYRQQAHPILKNLANKMANGTYDHEKAVKLYMYLMESGAKKYAREFANGKSDPTEWHRMFNVATRESAARMFATAFEAEWKAGSYRNDLTKAAAKRLAARG